MYFSISPSTTEYRTIDFLAKTTSHTISFHNWGHIDVNVPAADSATDNKATEICMDDVILVDCPAGPSPGPGPSPSPGPGPSPSPGPGPSPSPGPGPSPSPGPGPSPTPTPGCASVKVKAKAARYARRVCGALEQMMPARYPFPSFARLVPSDPDTA